MLAPLCEASLDQAEEAWPLPTWQGWLSSFQGHYGALDLRWRGKGTRPDPEGDAGAREKLDEHAQKAHLRWGCDHPLRDFALHHHHEALRRMFGGQQPLENRCRHVVRQVGDDDVRLPLGDRSEVDPQRIVVQHLDVRVLKALGQVRSEVAIEFDCNHLPGLASQFLGQNAESGADLDDERVRCECSGRDDALDDRAVVQEVLTERLARSDTEFREDGPQLTVWGSRRRAAIQGVRRRRRHQNPRLRNRYARVVHPLGGMPARAVARRPQQP
ncbi:hypothetical protein HRbin27_00592 [bacterium HR27]|nr:hypothetical protein HRbin27_00592 [bacterium HR27]